MKFLYKESFTSTRGSWYCDSPPPVTGAVGSVGLSLLSGTRAVLAASRRRPRLTSVLPRHQRSAVVVPEVPLSLPSLLFVSLSPSRSCTREETTDSG